MIQQKLHVDVNELNRLIDENNVDTLLFDNAFVSNKRIIEFFQLLKNSAVQLKIRPKGTQYLIGSSNSVDRGAYDLT
jgi:hypothetical protein